MISNRILRESENASSTHPLKAGDSEQKLPRMKAKALGDVQNTLHSRPGIFMTANSNSALKIPNKSSVYSKVSNKNTASGKKVNVTPIKAAKALVLSTPNIDNEMFEIHNHILCEKEHQSSVNDYLAEYKFSEEQINILTRSVKNFVTPLVTQNLEPCEDIEIPAMNNFEKHVFSVSDIFSDLTFPLVSAPLEAL